MDVNKTITLSVITQIRKYQVIFFLNVESIFNCIYVYVYTHTQRKGQAGRRRWGARDAQALCGCFLSHMDLDLDLTEGEPLAEKLGAAESTAERDGRHGSQGQ